MVQIGLLALHFLLRGMVVMQSLINFWIAANEYSNRRHAVGVHITPASTNSDLWSTRWSPSWTATSRSFLLDCRAVSTWAEILSLWEVIASRRLQQGCTNEGDINNSSAICSSPLSKSIVSWQCQKVWTSKSWDLSIAGRRLASMRTV